jgi:hypothetical protein
MDMLSMLKYGSDILKNLNNKVDRNDYLDPLSVIIILALNSYYPVGTKLAIHKNQIFLQSNNVLQGAQRYWYGDKKTDINILHYPILYAVKTYIINNVNYNEYNNELKDLFDKSRLGLIKLRDTYINKDIIYSINRLIEIFDYALEYNQNNNKSNNILDEDILDNNEIKKSSFNIIFEDKNTKENIKFQIYDEINKIWTKKHITTVLFLFDELKKKTDNNRDNMIYCIEYFIKDMETKLIEKVNLVFNL